MAWGSSTLREWIYASRFFYPGGRAPWLTLLRRFLTWRWRRGLGLLDRPAILATDSSPCIELLVPNLAQEYQLYMYRAPLMEAEILYLPRLVQPGMCAVNVGAHAGMYALAIAQLVGPSGHVHAFEPAAETYRQLMANVHWNQLRRLVGDNLSCYRLALSSSYGHVKLYRYESSLQNSLIPEAAEQSSEEVSAITLDRWMEERGIGQVDLLCMDVEGAEDRVLEGAHRLLSSRNAPVIMCELNKKFGTPDGIWDRLSGYGYTFWHYNARQDRPVPLSSPHSGEIYTNRQGIPGLGYGNVISAKPPWKPPE